MRLRRWVRRALVEIGAGCLYGLQVIADHIWTIMWVLVCTSVSAYWLTAWAYLILDRMGR